MKSLPALAALALAGNAFMLAGCPGMLVPRQSTPREQAAQEIRVLETDDYPLARQKAARTLGHLKSPEAIPVLVEALRDPTPAVRGLAAESLSKIPGAAAQALPPLREALARETVPAARIDQAWALKTLKAAPEEWAPAMRSLLRDPVPLTRHNAALGLMGHGDPVELFPVFFDEIGTEFGKKTSEHPYWLVNELVKGNDPRLIPLLIEGLKRPSTEQRAAAAGQLASFKPVPSAQITGPLIQALRDPEPEVREKTIISLQRVGYEARQGKVVGPPLVEALGDPDARVRERAAGAFHSMSQAPRAAIPALVRLLQDPMALVRAEAAFGLMGFIPPAREAVQPLIEALTAEGDPKVRVSIARALGSMGKEAKSAVPILSAALRDPDRTIRDAAASALELIERR